MILSVFWPGVDVRLISSLSTTSNKKVWLLEWNNEKNNCLVVKTQSRPVQLVSLPGSFQRLCIIRKLLIIQIKFLLWTYLLKKFSFFKFYFITVHRKSYNIAVFTLTTRIDSIGRHFLFSVAHFSTLLCCLLQNSSVITLSLEGRWFNDSSVVLVDA